MKRKEALSKSIVIPSIGTLYFQSEFERCWFGRIDTLGSNIIELSIETYNDDEPSKRQIELIQSLSDDYEYYLNLLYAYLEDAYKEFSLERIMQMYYLSAITLKVDDNTWFFTLEDNYTPPKYSFFQRFTVVDYMITWSNVPLE